MPTNHKATLSASPNHKSGQGRQARLSPGRERELLRRWHLHGDQQARATLVEKMLPLVRHIARSYVGQGETLEDLVQVGCIGLVQAIDRFDIDRGLRLSTFATPTIAGEIKRHFRDRTWMLRTPRSLKELSATLGVAREQFASENGRSPTVAELCQQTGHGEKDVLDALEAGRNYAVVSLDAPARENEDRLPSDGIGTHEAGFDRADDRTFLRQKLKVLPERERRIIVLRFGGGLTQREIADRIGLSQMQVSRLLTQSIDQMAGSPPEPAPAPSSTSYAVAA